MRTLTRILLNVTAACALALPLAWPAAGAETTGKASPTEPVDSWAASARPMTVPPVADLPWMDAPQTPTHEGLIGGRMETLGPFLLQPNSPTTRTSASTFTR
jgi:hypothetical protein